MVLVLTALFAGGSGPSIVSIGPLRVTVDGVMQGLLLAARLLALGLAFFFWLSTTDQAAMVRGFVALKMPYTWGLTLALALRYLPILAGLFEQVREAQQARGLDLGQKRFFERLSAYRPVLIAMLIDALRNSERLGWALKRARWEHTASGARFFDRCICAAPDLGRWPRLAACWSRESLSACCNSVGKITFVRADSG